MSDDDRIWQLAIAVNAAFKGLLGYEGESGHVCARTIAVQVPLHPERGTSSLWEEISVAVCDVDLADGDTVVLPDKIIAIGEGRTGPRSLLDDNDPKRLDAAARAQVASVWQQVTGHPISDLHLLLADCYESPDGRALVTLGVLDHNGSAASLSDVIFDATGVRVDVVISDTDTGLDVRRPLIGTVTIGATPLGATAGLTIYEAMRCACAAEFTRGHRRGIPIVICRPAERCAKRPQTGDHRGYSGALDLGREGGLTYA
jgi:F420-0:gamma-glutamyl ligase